MQQSVISIDCAAKLPLAIANAKPHTRVDLRESKDWLSNAQSGTENEIANHHSASVVNDGAVKIELIEVQKKPSDGRY